MANGTVKWFNATKGYGFIAPEDGGADVFVHIRQVEQSGMSELQDNQKVSFDVETGNNGKAKQPTFKLYNRTIIVDLRKRSGSLGAFFLP